MSDASFRTTTGDRAWRWDVRFYVLRGRWRVALIRRPRLFGLRVGPLLLHIFANPPADSLP